MDTTKLILSASATHDDRAFLQQLVLSGELRELRIHGLVKSTEVRTLLKELGLPLEDGPVFPPKAE